MEIPLVLRDRADGRLVYSVPWPFRAGMALGCAAVGAASLAAGGSTAAWIAMGILALAGLYEERWTFDSGAREIVHGTGLVILAKKTRIALGDVACLRLSSLARGTVPGSSEEEAVNRAALAGLRPDYPLRRGRSYPKAYLRLSLELKDGTRILVYLSGSPGSRALRLSARRIADRLGLGLAEG